MRIGVAGLGVVGGTLFRWLRQHTQHDVCGEDPAAGFSMTESESPLDALFVCVPVPTNGGLVQDLTHVHQVIRDFGASARIFVRSSVLPGTCDSLASMHGREVFAMPEFLTERTAAGDFDVQGLICGAPEGRHTEQYAFLKSVFDGRKDLTLMTNVEAELAKYMHNGNGTIKVHFNNLVYQLAKRLGADYTRVQFGALMSGYVCANHTDVPGPDGLLGYGGKCFPKDMAALIGLMEQHQVPCGSLREMQAENRAIRGHQ
jgi:UDPglucose 6-dehydrogenase